MWEKLKSLLPGTTKHVVSNKKDIKDIDYNRFIASNVYSEEETKKQIRGTLQFISESLKKTLGPYGSTTIVQDKYIQHFMSKDGYSVLKKIFIKQDVPRTVLDIIKNISKTLVRTVGDGSTSSIIIANELFKEIDKISNEYNIPPKDLTDMLDVCFNVLRELIFEKSVEITDENREVLNDIAIISTNNDIDAGNLIYEILNKIGKYGYATIELSKSENDSYDITSGIEVKRGYIHHCFAGDSSNNEVELENPFIIMSNGMITDADLPALADLMENICNKHKEKLVIMAPSYSPAVKHFMMINKNRNPELPFIAIDIPFKTPRSQERFDDLAIAIGAKPVDVLGSGEQVSDLLDETLFGENRRVGFCEKVVVSEGTSKFIGTKGDEKKVQERIDFLEEEMHRLMRKEDHIDRDDYIINYQRRIASLAQSMAVIYVGGKSEAEKTTRRFLMEDAFYACKSALEHGYIIGGNLIIPNILHNKDNMGLLKRKLRKKLIHIDDDKKADKLIADFLQGIKRSFLHSFETVLRNAHLDDNTITNIINKCLDERLIYNLKTFKYENDEDTLIVNSSETDVEIAKATFSIIGLLATSNQLITVNTKDGVINNG